MKIFDKFSVSAAASRLNDETLYAFVSEEIEKGIKRDGLWIKAVADAKGNESIAKANYIKLRVQSLKDEAKLEQSIIDQKLEEASLAKAREAQSQKSQSDKNFYDNPPRYETEPPDFWKIVTSILFCISFMAFLIALFLP